MCVLFHRYGLIPGRGMDNLTSALPASAVSGVHLEQNSCFCLHTRKQTGNLSAQLVMLKLLSHFYCDLVCCAPQLGSGATTSAAALL